MVALAFSCDWLFFHAVSAMECMTKKASALPSDLNRNRVNGIVRLFNDCYLSVLRLATGSTWLLPTASR